MTSWTPTRPCPIPGHPQNGTDDARPQPAPGSGWARIRAWHMRAPAERLPLPAFLITWPASEVLHVAGVPGYVPGCVTCTAAAVSYLTWRWHGKRSPHPRLAALEAAAVTAGIGAWVTAADLWGPLGWPEHFLTYLYVVGAAAGYAWLRTHHAVLAARKRREDAAAEAADRRAWHAILHRAGLSGWHVQWRRDTNLGEERLITTSPENALASRIAGNSSGIAEKLAHILGLPYGRIDIRKTEFPGELIISIRTVDVSAREAAFHPMTLPWPEKEPSPFAEWFSHAASIRDPAPWGFCPEDGSPLFTQLLSEIGGRVVGVIGMTGSGKSNLLNNLREFVTRCPDARMVQLNGAHMGDELTWEPLSALTLCGPVATDEKVRNDIAEALQAMCLLVTQRSATLAQTGHSTYQPTGDDPAVVIFIDEVDEIVKHVPGAGEMLDFLASKQRKSAVCLVEATQRAVIKSLGGGAVRANMSEVLVGKVARATEARHASGAETEIPDIREYAKGAPGYFQKWDPHSGTITGRGRALLLGKPPEELAYIRRLVDSRRHLRDWSIPDMPPLALDGGEAAAGAVSEAAASQEITGLRDRLARIRTETATGTAPGERSQDRPREAAGNTVPMIPGVPPEAVSVLIPLLASGRTSSAAAGTALGISKSAAHRYLQAMREYGHAETTGAGPASGWRLARRTQPPETAPGPEQAQHPDGYVTIADLAEAVHEGLVSEVDDDARQLLEQVHDLIRRQRITLVQGDQP